MGGCSSILAGSGAPVAGKPAGGSSKDVVILLSGDRKKTTHVPKPPTSAAVKVICPDGRVAEFTPPVTAAQAVAAATGGDGKGWYLCGWDSMYVEEFAPAVAAAEELTAAQVYFVLPAVTAARPLTLPEMCELAIKASSGLSLDDFHLSLGR